ncbi:TolC family protein [Trichothermofontia sp.]
MRSSPPSTDPWPDTSSGASETGPPWALRFSLVLTVLSMTGFFLTCALRTYLVPEAIAAALGTASPLAGPDFARLVPPDAFSATSFLGHRRPPWVSRYQSAPLKGHTYRELALVGATPSDRPVMGMGVVKRLQPTPWLHPPAPTAIARPSLESQTHDLTSAQSAPVQPAAASPITTPVPPTVPPTQTLQLTLEAAIVLALENNRTAKNDLLERIAQQADLAVAMSKFSPRVTPRLGATLSRNTQGDTGTDTVAAAAGIQVEVLLPTGLQLAAQWSGDTGLRNLSGVVTTETTDDSLRSQQGLELSLKQPLLRGAGSRVNRASVRAAQLTDQRNIEQLRQQLTAVINGVITAYRDLLTARQAVMIQQHSLANAEELLRVTEALVKAGRQARSNLVQSQAAIANRQVQLVQAQNTLEATRLQLLDRLDLEPTLYLEPAITTPALPALNEVWLDPAALLAFALANQPEYRQAQLDTAIAAQNLTIAVNAQHWNLDLDGRYRHQTSTDQSDQAEWLMALTFSRTLGDLTPQQQLRRSQVNLRQAENTLAAQHDRLQIAIQNHIRDIQVRWQQVNLAKQATALAEQQLRNEQEKFRRGRSQIDFVIQQQDALATTQLTELGEIVSYLNALTDLDTTIGRTLQVWQVTIPMAELP